MVARNLKTVGAGVVIDGNRASTMDRLWPAQIHGQMEGVFSWLRMPEMVLPQLLVGLY